MKVKFTLRADGRLIKKVTVDGKPQYLYANSQEEAEAIYTEFLAKINSPKIDTKMKSLSKWVDLWWEEHKKSISPNTIDSYLKPIADVKDHFGTKDILKIKPIEISKFIGSLANQGFARQTINLRLIVLCKTYDYAMLNNAATFNPARVVTLPRNLKKGTRESLAEEEIKAVATSNNIFAKFLLYTGLRRNEALAVMWEDIDFDNFRIVVNKQVLWEKDTSPRIINETKTKKGIRTVPLLQPLTDALILIKKKKGLIFGKDGKPLSESDYRTLWNSVRSDTGCNNITAHQFRHAYITMLWASGIDMKTAQTLSGHKKIEVMYDIYTHLDTSASDKAGDILNNYLNPKKE